MNKAVEILKEKQKELKHTIKFYKEEMQTFNEAITNITNPEFVKSIQEKNCWSDKWTVDDFITTNLDSNERALKNYTDLLEKANNELQDIKSALKILKKNGVE